MAAKGAKMSPPKALNPPFPPLTKGGEEVVPFASLIVQRWEKDVIPFTASFNKGGERGHLLHSPLL